MSLDIYLTGETTKKECTCNCGHTHLVDEVETFYSANITHNLNAMAEEAGIYKALWHPEDLLGITKAGQLIEPLKAGLALLESDRARFEKFNAENGWGTYKHFVPFVKGVLNACEEFPGANVRVSR